MLYGGEYQEIVTQSGGGGGGGGRGASVRMWDVGGPCRKGYIHDMAHTGWRQAVAN